LVFFFREFAVIKSKNGRIVFVADSVDIYIYIYVYKQRDDNSHEGVIFPCTSPSRVIEQRSPRLTVRRSDPFTRMMDACPYNISRVRRRTKTKTVRFENEPVVLTLARRHCTPGPYGAVSSTGCPVHSSASGVPGTFVYSRKVFRGFLLRGSKFENAIVAPGPRTIPPESDLPINAKHAFGTVLFRALVRAEFGFRPGRVRLLQSRENIVPVRRTLKRFKIAFETRRPAANSESKKGPRTFRLPFAGAKINQKSYDVLPWEAAEEGLKRVKN